MVNRSLVMRLGSYTQLNTSWELKWEPSNSHCNAIPIRALSPEWVATRQLADSPLQYYKIHLIVLNFHLKYQGCKTWNKLLNIKLSTYLYFNIGVWANLCREHTGNFSQKYISKSHLNCHLANWLNWNFK